MYNACRIFGTEFSVVSVGSAIGGIGREAVQLTSVVDRVPLQGAAGGAIGAGVRGVGVAYCFDW